MTLSVPIGITLAPRMETVLSKASATVRLTRSMRFLSREGLLNRLRRRVSKLIRNRWAEIGGGSKCRTSTMGKANSCRVVALR